VTPSPDSPGSALSERTGPNRLEGLWATHSEKVYRAAYRVTGNAADAEDAVQTVFLRLARLPEGKLREDAGGFLHRSAVNAGLDILRSRQRAGWVPLERVEVVASSSLGNPERDRSTHELRRHLRLALSRLSPRAAEMFALRYFEGLGNGEIADLLDVSPGVVAVLLHRTRARLRKELRALEGEVS
jgi:RNA polymerase sigma-70 factor (ECF subfamily)